MVFADIKNRFGKNQDFFIITLILIFFANYEKTLSADFQFAQMDLALATLVLIRVLRTLINSIAKNLHKLQICLRFYSFCKKLDIQTIIIKFDISEVFSGCCRFCRYDTWIDSRVDFFSKSLKVFQ